MKLRGIEILVQEILVVEGLHPVEQVVLLLEETHLGQKLLPLLLLGLLLYGRLRVHNLDHHATVLGELLVIQVFDDL